MQRLYRTVGIVLALVVGGVPALAADNPLQAIPQEAGVVIRWVKPTETVKKSVEFVDSVDPDTGRMLRPLSLGIGVTISNPELAGLDKARDWYIAVFPKVEGDPGIVFAIPASDADAMQEAVMGEFTFARHEDWLLYAEDAALIETIQARIDGKGEPVAARIDQESRAFMDKNDLSVFLNVPRLRVIYKEQLDSAEQRFDQELGQIENIAPAAPGMNLKPVFEMYGQMFRGIMQGVKDTEGVTLGLTVTKEGIDFETLARVAADSATDKAIASQKKSDFKRLAGLPQGSHAYFAASGDVNSLATWGTKLSAAMYTGEDGLKEAIDEASKEMSKLDFGAFFVSFGIGGADGGILRVANFMEVKPAEKMRDLTRKMMRSMGELEAGPVKQEIELKADAEEYGERKGDVVTTRQQIDPELDPLGIQTQINRVFYGEEGQVQRVVYLKDGAAQTMGGGREAMEKLLKSLDAPPADTGKTGTGDTAKANGPAAATRARLSPEANMVGLVDLPLLVTDLVQAVIQASQLPIPVDTDGLKKSMGDKRSYIGLSLAGGEQSAHLKLHVPLLQAQNTAKLVKEARRLAQQQQQF
jgi:hypothetical protein